MKPSTMVGSTSNSSCSHSRKRRPASRSGTSKSAVRAPSSRYESTSCARVRSTAERVEASVVSTRPRRALNRTSHSSARWLARLPSARANLASASLHLDDGLVGLPPFFHQLAPEVRLLGLQGGHLLRQPAAFALRSRLLPDGVRVLRLKSLDFGRHICSKGTRRHAVGEVGRLKETHETTIPMKTADTKVQLNLLDLAPKTAAATPPLAGGTWCPPRP
jgi:hypothetical protein